MAFGVAVEPDLDVRARADDAAPDDPMIEYPYPYPIVTLKAEQPIIGGSPVEGVGIALHNAGPGEKVTVARVVAPVLAFVARVLRPLRAARSRRVRPTRRTGIRRGPPRGDDDDDPDEDGVAAGRLGRAEP